jgi:hypothetical protein
MNELSPKYLNEYGKQVILICSLLSGFSIAVIANLIVNTSDTRVTNSILIVSTIAAACFLIAVFAMSRIVMMTTDGYPTDTSGREIDLPLLVGASTYTLGLVFLSIFIALSGWTKSRRMGVFTTIVGAITFIMIIVNL